jgi:formate-dependent nitrite reductase membrane component NrfD
MTPETPPPEPATPRPEGDARPDGSDGRRTAGDKARAGYYGLPPIHKPHWGWEIVAYFFLGGLSGGSYVVASLADLVGGAGGYLSFATLLPCPILLILDLGRPERFLHMLRVVKLRSPMSVGTWGLLAFSGFATLSALIQAAEDGLLGRAAPGRALAALPARSVGLAGSGAGFFLGGYTGVLLAATAVPLWAKNATLMGPLFLTSALTNGGAAIALLLAATGDADERTLAPLERLELLALLAELGLLLTFERRLGPTIARPLTDGRYGLLYRGGVLGLGLGVPLALGAKRVLLGGKPSRGTTALSAILTLAGGVLLRQLMVMAGKASADDPAATFAFTRRPDGQEGASWQG